MNRLIGNTIKSVGVIALAISLAGCFNNMSGLDYGTSQSSTSGAQLNDSGFANETGPIDTAAVLIGPYNDSGGSGFGIMIDLQKSLAATLGADSVTAIVSTIDTNTAMQARPVTIHLPSYGIKATTTLGALAAGNNGKLRNIMNIRPRLTRVDLTTSALDLPWSPSVIQLNNANNTVVTYGGKIEGSFIRRMTVLIPFAGVNAGFLPSTSVPTYGDGYPSASPAEQPNSVKLVRVTADIATLFGKLMVNVPYGPSFLNGIQSDAIKTINQTKDSLVLAVHYKMNPDGTVMMDTDANLRALGFGPGATGITPTGVPLIDAAYFININPANNSGPETVPFCHSGYDFQDLSSTYGVDANGNPTTTVDFSNYLACNCTAATYSPSTSNPPLSSQFTDPCPSIGVTGSGQAIPVMTLKQKKDLIAAAVAASQPAPTSGTIPIATPITVNGFVLSQE